MSESVKAIDVRNEACPGPVIAAKKALEAGGFDMLEVLVGNETARENVERFAAYAGHRAVGSERRGDAYAVRIKPKSAGGDAAAAAVAPGAAATPGAAPAPRAPGGNEGAGPDTILIASDALGTGNDELGALLLRGFCTALKEAPTLPTRIILMNGGVRLAVEGTQPLESLRLLEGRGVEILACGTCLDFFGLKERLAVGRVSNMFEIASFLLAGRTLRI